MNVADALQTKYYEDGEVIINQVSTFTYHSQTHSLFTVILKLYLFYLGIRTSHHQPGARFTKKIV